MAYAHAKAGERCAKCNDYAHRVVAAQPLCLDHFTTLIDGCLAAVKQRLLAPVDLTPEGFEAWAVRLDHGITIGAITTQEARDAWETAREFAA